MKPLCIAIAFLTLAVHHAISEEITPLNSGSHLDLDDDQPQCADKESCVTNDRRHRDPSANGSKFIRNKLHPRNRVVFNGLRQTNEPLRQSRRESNPNAPVAGLRIQSSSWSAYPSYVPLRNVSVVAYIKMFVADVTLTQLFVNQEANPIEAVYVFPLEENAAVYSFTAEIDNRTITAVLKEKETAEKEYKEAVSQGKVAAMLRQSQETLDTFTINVGALPAGKECRITLRYVTELESIEKNSIRFVVPTTIAPRYNPSLSTVQSPGNTQAHYVHATPYSMFFQAHIFRSEEYEIKQVANLSHPVNISLSAESIDISSDGIDLDRDIILDLDLSEYRSATLVAMEKYRDSTKYAVLVAFYPSAADIEQMYEGEKHSSNEYIFVVDCSGSMGSEDKIGLAREAMQLFLRSLPVGSYFNIIRFGSDYDVLFKNEKAAAVYNEANAKQAEELLASLSADFGGTEILESLQYLKSHPPSDGRSRQIFLLTDGEVSNTHEVIHLCRSMSSNTRIFSFGLGHAPSRSLVKGLARATNGHFVFVPPGEKVDTYVASQLGRATQAELVDVHLRWHGLSTDVLQSPRVMPPLRANDRVLVYTLLDGRDLAKNRVSVTLTVGDQRVRTMAIADDTATSGDSIRRLAAKALIQELQHEKPSDTADSGMTREQSITKLSLAHQILSPYTAFIAVQTENSVNGSAESIVRHVPIQTVQNHETVTQSVPALSYTSVFDIESVLERYPRATASPSIVPRQTESTSKSTSTETTAYSGPASFALHDTDTGTTATTRTTATDASSDIPAAPVRFSTTQPIPRDTVRWLISEQTFNGAWILSEQDVLQLTNNKPFDSFTLPQVGHSKEVLETALAIAVLESRHANQKTLWNAIVEKARKRLQTLGLSVEQVNELLDAIKNQL